MKNFNTPKYTLAFNLMVAVLILTIGYVNAQDFILTTDYELIRCRITIDSPAYIQYSRKDGRILIRNKSSVLDYANLSKKKANDLEITDRQGLVLRGTFLFADQDSVYFWKGSKKYHPDKGTFLAVGINELDRMVILRKGKFFLGFGIGFPCGVLSAFYPAVVLGAPLEAGEPFALPVGLAYGVAGGAIGALTRKRFQFNDPTEDLSEYRD